MRVVDNVGFDVKKQDIPGGGSGNAQPLATPDYLQNDETAADYIKNRPFYTTDPVETELVNGTFAFVEVRIGLYANTDIAVELTEGETYKVSIGGVEYETVCQSLNGALYIGSVEIIKGENPEYPFVYTPAEGSFATNIEGVSHDIVIKSFAQEVVKIDAKYLPVAEGDMYGVVKKSEIVSSYQFPAKVPRAEIIKAISEFSNGKANITWAGSHVIDAFYDDSDDSINCIFATNPFRQLKYLNQNGFYRYDLDSPKYIDVSEGFLRIYNDGGIYTTISTKGEQSNSTMVFGCAHLAIYGDEILNRKELLLFSSTANSTKKFKITVDDSGTLKATEVTG